MTTPPCLTTRLMSQIKQQFIISDLAAYMYNWRQRKSPDREICEPHPHGSFGHDRQERQVSSHLIAAQLINLGQRSARPRHLSPTRAKTARDSGSGALRRRRQEWARGLGDGS
jgi:hypothetical protein